MASCQPFVPMAAVVVAVVSLSGCGTSPEEQLTYDEGYRYGVRFASYGYDFDGACQSAARVSDAAHEWRYEGERDVWLDACEAGYDDNS